MKLRKNDEGLKPSELRVVPRLNTKNTRVLYGGSIRFYHFLAATLEMAFIQAISAAAITHEIAYRCTENKIPGCGCPLPVSNWSNCGDNISFGEKKSRPFTERLKTQHDAQTVVNPHNNQQCIGKRGNKSYLQSLQPYRYLRGFLCVLALIYVYVTVRGSSNLRRVSDTWPGHFLGRS